MGLHQRPLVGNGENNQVVHGGGISAAGLAAFESGMSALNKLGVDGKVGAGDQVVVVYLGLWPHSLASFLRVIVSQ